MEEIEKKKQKINPPKKEELKPEQKPPAKKEEKKEKKGAKGKKGKKEVEEPVVEPSDVTPDIPESVKEETPVKEQPYVKLVRPLNRLTRLEHNLA